ncbi:hypothetical protein [Hyphomicrobium sp. ghe19]|uniref:hypothetical protein n=1 Tax=Hyphomicrobium sp. ghe19 TaxID=2682968 RepID=UPI001367789D|nr:hypothetical protein HYPP_02387 [Hyphomicrobium sp. ghe19]
MTVRFYEKIAEAEEAHRLRLAEMEAAIADALCTLRDAYRTKGVEPNLRVVAKLAAECAECSAELARSSAHLLEAEKSAASHEFGIYPKFPLIH